MPRDESPLTPQMAQAGGGGGAAPIGRVDTVTGTATVQRVDGTTATLEQGAPVFAKDVISTQPGAKVALVFADKTTFALGESGQMKLDEMVYNPAAKSGKMALSMIKGAFAFATGDIASTEADAMTVRTPIGTIGIRGTAVAGEVKPGGESTFAALPDPSGAPSIIAFTNAGGTRIVTENTMITVQSFFSPPSAPVSTAGFNLGEAGALSSIANTLSTLVNPGGSAQGGTGDSGTTTPAPSGAPTGGGSEGGGAKIITTNPVSSGTISGESSPINQAIANYQNEQTAKGGTTVEQVITGTSPPPPPPPILQSPPPPPPPVVTSPPPPPATDPFTFIGTTGTDRFTGTPASETFDFDRNKNSLTPGDMLDGGGGADVLNAVFTSPVQLANVTITNIPTINITFAGNSSIDADLITGGAASSIIAKGFGVLAVTHLKVNFIGTAMAEGMSVSASVGGITIAGGAGSDTITTAAAGGTLPGGGSSLGAVVIEEPPPSPPGAPPAAGTVVSAGAGNNELHGGAQDTVDYSDAPNSIRVNLATGQVIDNGYGGADAIPGFGGVAGSKNGTTNTVDLGPNQSAHLANIQFVHGDSVEGGNALLLDAAAASITVDHVASVTGSAGNDLIISADAAGSAGMHVSSGGGVDAFVRQTSGHSDSLSGVSVVVFQNSDTLGLANSVALDATGPSGTAVLFQGSTTDDLTINGTGDSFVTVSGAEAVLGVGANSYGVTVQGPVTAGSVFTLQGAAGNDFLLFDATGAVVATVDGAEHILAGNTGQNLDLTLTGGFEVIGGAGNDTIQVASDEGVFISGGAGNNVLVGDGDTSILDFFYAPAGATVSITGATGGGVLTGTTGNNGYGGTDTFSGFVAVSGSSAADLFWIGGGFGGSLEIDGVGGIDTMSLNGGASSYYLSEVEQVVAGAGSYSATNVIVRSLVSEFFSIDLSAAGGAKSLEFKLDGGANLTFGDGSIAGHGKLAGIGMVQFHNGINQTSSYSITLDGTAGAVHLDGSFSLTGSLSVDASAQAAAVTITGGAGGGTALGGAGNDAISYGGGTVFIGGGGGDNTLNGGGTGVLDYTLGSGNAFVFLPGGCATNGFGGNDQISGFTSVYTGAGEDTIVTGFASGNFDGGGGYDNAIDFNVLGTSVVTIGGLSEGLGGVVGGVADNGGGVVQNFSHFSQITASFGSTLSIAAGVTDLDEVDLACGFIKYDDGCSDIAISGFENVVNLSSNAIVIYGTDGANVLTAGSGGDTIDGAGYGDMLTAGAGADLFRYYDSNDSSSKATAAADGETDSIVGFDDSVDRIDAGPDANFFGGQKSGADFADAFGDDLAGEVSYAVIGGNTYVHVSAGGGFSAQNDILIELQGTHALTADTFGGLTTAPEFDFIVTAFNPGGGCSQNTVSGFDSSGVFFDDVTSLTGNDEMLFFSPVVDGDGIREISLADGIDSHYSLDAHVELSGFNGVTYEGTDNIRIVGDSSLSSETLIGGSGDDTIIVGTFENSLHDGNGNGDFGDFNELYFDEFLDPLTAVIDALDAEAGASGILTNGEGVGDFAHFSYLAASSGSTLEIAVDGVQYVDLTYGDLGFDVGANCGVIGIEGFRNVTNASGSGIELVGNFNINTITTGFGTADTVIGGGSGDILMSNSGFARFIYESTFDSRSFQAAGVDSSTDVISGFVDASNVIDLRDIQTAFNFVGEVSGTDFDDAFGDASQGDVSWAVIGGNTYVHVSATGGFYANTDLIIQIANVHALTESNFDLADAPPPPPPPQTFTVTDFYTAFGDTSLASGDIDGIGFSNATVLDPVDVPGNTLILTAGVDGDGLTQINLDAGVLVGASSSSPVDISGFALVEYEGAGPMTWVADQFVDFGAGQTLIGGSGNDYMYAAGAFSDDFYDGNGTGSFGDSNTLNASLSGYSSYVTLDSFDNAQGGVVQGSFEQNGHMSELAHFEALNFYSNSTLELGADADNVYNVDLENTRIDYSGGWVGISGVDHVINNSGSSMVIEGNSNANHLTAGSAGDVLVGLYGADTLVSGGGADVFGLIASTDSAEGYGIDVIQNFLDSGAMLDRIETWAIGGNTFVGETFGSDFATAFAGGNAGDIEYAVIGGDTFVHISNGSGYSNTDAVVMLQGTHALTASNFVTSAP